jgi:N4-gp56 family major capsid protein
VPDVYTLKADLAATITFELRKQTIPVVRDALRYAQFGQDAKFTPGTDTMKWVKNPDIAELGSVAAYQLNADEITSPLSEALAAITTVTATSTPYGRVVGISRRNALYSPLDMVAHAKDTLAFDAARLMDTIVRDEVTANGTVQYAASRASRITVAAGDNFKMDEARKILTKIDSLNLPTSDLVAITHPFVVGDLRGDAATPGGWQNAHAYASDGALFSGEAGRAYGIRFVTTMRAKKFTAAGAAGIDVYTTMVGLGQWSHGKVGVEALRFEAVAPGGDHADVLALQWKLGWAVDFAAKTLDSTKFIRFESAANTY